MDNLKQWIIDTEIEKGEQITAIVVGVHYDDRWSTSRDRRPQHQRNTVLSREDGLTLIDVEFDSGYGGANCFPITAWTDNWVFVIGEYDGATHLATVPRHPVAHSPEFV